MTTTPTRRRLSGFCNPTLSRTSTYDPHQQCRPHTGGCDCTVAGCPCAPVPDPPQEHPMPVDQKPSDQGAEHATPQVSPGDHDVPQPGTPEAELRILQDTTHLLNRSLTGYHPDDWRDAVRLLHDLRRAEETLKALDATLVRWLYLHGEHGLHLQVDGVPGEVSITRGRTRERWEGETAVRDYVEARIRINDGELPDPDQVIEWVLEVVPAGKCRVTPLRDAGLDVGDYRESEPGNLQVGLPKHDVTG